MHSPDLTSDNIDKLAELFPTVVTEGLDEDGNPVRAIDFDLLRQELSDHVVDGPQERYQLDWPGKRAALFAANAPIAKTLRPVREESVDFDTTKNLFIEGDNLDALKLLQESYLGKVKLIYIDPPYNTGSDMLYPDDFSKTTDEYLEQSGQADGEGNRMVANLESNGRFHSDWLSMLLPRLKLARRLLSNDGAFVVSIDDNELPRLLQLGSEVFGQDNLLNVIAVKSSEASGVKMSHATRKLPKMKEYLVVFARDKASVRLTPVQLDKARSGSGDGVEGGALDDYLKYYTKVIVDPELPVESWEILPIEAYLAKNGQPSSKDAVRRFQIDNADRVIYRTNNATLANLSFPTATASVESATGLSYVWWEGKQMLFLADYLRETLGDLWTDISTINLNKETLGVDGFGQGQKPLELIRRLLHLFTSDDPEALVVDFFGGSGTTAHAVLQANAEDGGTRSFVLVQYPEELDETKKEHARAIATCDDLGLPRTIASLAKERIRRAASQCGSGVRVLKVDSTSMTDTSRAPDEVQQNQLSIHVDSVKPGRTAEDLLFQVLLDWGLEVSAPIMLEEIDGQEVLDVDGGALIACFASDVRPGAIRAIAQRGPLRAVFRDSAFGSDADRINAEQIFAELSPATDVKVI